MSTETGRDSDKFMLRFPDGMRDQIKAAADTNRRSMNAEIIARLSFTLSHDALNAEIAALTLSAEADEAEVEQINNTVESLKQLELRAAEREARLTGVLTLLLQKLEETKSTEK